MQTLGDVSTIHDEDFGKVCHHDIFVLHVELP